MANQLPENFILGAASSAWQTEGWKGKKEGQDSYLDKWFKQENFVWHNGKGPDVATNFYERFQEDIDLMKEIGLTHFRTSINWSRFFTDYETFTVDEEYANYISNIIDSLINANIRPMLCLEHYELPAYLNEKYDGWSSKIVVELFTKYAEIVFNRYGDRVKDWFVFNEPIVVQTRVYLDAIRWPHEQNTKKWMQWNHNKVLATAKVVKAYKEGDHEGRIGTILNPEVTYPRSSSEADKKAARIFDLLYNRVFLDPAVRGEYPEELIELLEKHDILPEFDSEEMEIIKNNTVDFVGVNLYFPKRVQAPKYMWNPDTPFHPQMYYDNFDLPGRQMNTSRGWEIYPKLMYDMAMRLKNEYGNIPWLITENGMGIDNEEDYTDNDGRIQDDYRIDFIREHISWLIKAVEEGSSCEGYMLWAFTDCVSPMNAFKNRYGLVSINVDDNLNRSLKKSAYWYKKVIKNNQID